MGEKRVTIDGIIYEFKYGQAGVVGWDFNVKMLPSILIPEKVQGYPVHYIGEKAFHGCYDLQEIILPTSCSAIRERAFAICENLKCIAYDNSNIHTSVYIGEYAFDGCVSLTTVNVQFGRIQIGEHAFNRCVNLKEVWGDINDIRGKGFYHCYKLDDLSIANDALISAHAFYKSAVRRIRFKGDLKRPSKIMMQNLKKTKILCTKQFPFLDCVYEGYDMQIGLV